LKLKGNLREKGEAMLKAKDIMTRDLITVKPTTTIEDLARILMEHQISGTPVVDDNGKLIGIVTENDLISKNSRLHIPTILRLFDAFIPLGTSRLELDIKRMAASAAGDICTKEVVTADAEASVEYIATLMTEKKIHLLPVTEEGKLIGIIGKKDLIRAIAAEASE
jgi:CBS domain-containing protein